MNDTTTHTKTEAKTQTKRIKYSSLLIISSGGQGFEDTSLAGLLAQTQEGLDSYHRPGTFGDYDRADYELNVRTVWSIMADEPNYIDEKTGERHYFADPTIH